MEGILEVWHGYRLEEMNRGAELKIPRFFYYILKYIVPIYIIVLLIGWIWQDISSDTSTILMRGIEPKHALFQWIARLTILGVILGIGFLVKMIWSRKK
jgi:hypothetical protein